MCSLCAQVHCPVTGERGRAAPKLPALDTLTFAAYSAERAAAQGEPFPERDALVLGALGLCGEAGEVAEPIKKHLYHGKPLDREKLLNELGDVLWYVNYTARALGFSLAQVADANNRKLRARYPQGFSVEAAQAAGKGEG